MLGVAISTAALIIVMSVFNGLGELLRSLYTTFDPQIKIEAVQGKSFLMTDDLRNKIKQAKGVEILTEVIEDYVYVRYQQPDNLPEDEFDSAYSHYELPKGESEMVVTMKGVSDNFIDQHRLDESIISGDLLLHKNKAPAAIVGKGIRNTLSISVESDFVPLRIYYVKDLKGSALNPASMYAQAAVMPVGVFSIEKNYDENYIFVPLETAQQLMNYGEKRTSLEIKLKEGAGLISVQNELKKILGETFQVLSNDEQHKDLYRLLKLEKLFTTLSLTVLIAVAALNIFFSLMMLVIDKKKDISILSSLGASPPLIRNIFVAEAFVISGVGALIGLTFGATLVWFQDNVGLVGMGMENAVAMNYPVKLMVSDMLFVALIIMAITVLISWLPARAATRSIELNAL